MKNFYSYFCDIAKIYHGSKNEKEISNYIVNFAKEHNLEYYQDKFYNVIIKKPASSQAKQNKTIGLQCHMDMVCCKEFDYDFDFRKDKIKLIKNGNTISGYKTSIGADNGVGLCMILVLLASKCPCPNIEAIFTVQEETTVLGAKKLNYNLIKSKTILSLDGTNEGVAEISSASMREVVCTKKLKLTKPKTNNFYQLSVSGLLGGHSGDDINKNRYNAIKVLIDILSKIKVENICKISGGSASNSIPNYAECVFSSASKKENIEKVCKKFLDNISKVNPNVSIAIEDKQPQQNVASFKDSQNIISYLLKFKQGVLNAYSDGFPIASQNLGKINLFKGVLSIVVSVRSSSNEFEKEAFEQIKVLAKEHKLKLKSGAVLPYFACNENSELIKLLDDVYKSLNGKKLIKEHIHAGCEAGIFANNIKDLQMCIISPTLYDIHSPKEHFELDSVSRTLTYLKEILKAF